MGLVQFAQNRVSFGKIPTGKCGLHRKVAKGALRRIVCAVLPRKTLQSVVCKKQKVKKWKK